MGSKPTWIAGWNGAATPYDYGWMCAVEDRPFGPDVYFPDRKDYDDYKEGYNEAKSDWRSY